MLTIEGDRKQRIQVALLDDATYALVIDNVIIEAVRWRSDQFTNCRATAYAIAKVPMPPAIDSM